MIRVFLLKKKRKINKNVEVMRRKCNIDREKKYKLQVISYCKNIQHTHTPKKLDNVKYFSRTKNSNTQDVENRFLDIVAYMYVGTMENNLSIFLTMVHFHFNANFCVNDCVPFFFFCGFKELSGGYLLLFDRFNVKKIYKLNNQPLSCICSHA